MPKTALSHFREDIDRARAIVDHASSLKSTGERNVLLRSDLLRSAWMFSVGALDAYFSDAYTDLIASTLNSKHRQQTIQLPAWFCEIKFPLRAILEDYDKSNWRWRMAAREMMEDQNVLSLETIRQMFNKFFRDHHKLFGDVLEAWIQHPDAKQRVFGMGGPAYQTLAPKEKNDARKDARKLIEERFADIIQRRHDCIHNCDRPKMSPQQLDRPRTVYKVIQDIEFLVFRFDEHVTNEFPEFLRLLGCSQAVIAQTGY